MSEGDIEIKKSEITPTTDNFKSELKPIFDPLFSTLGHGTRTDAAKQAMEDGLKAKTPDLFSTTIPLFDATKTYEEQVDQVINTLTHWPHLDSKAIVVVMIPNPEEGEQGGSTYFNSVFEELPGGNTEHEERFVVPGKYIKGYVDIEKKEFIPNPNFDPEKPTLKPPWEPDLLRPTQNPQASQDIPTIAKDKKTPVVW